MGFIAYDGSYGDSLFAHPSILTTLHRSLPPKRARQQPQYFHHHAHQANASEPLPLAVPPAGPYRTSFPAGGRAQTPRETPASSCGRNRSPTDPRRSLASCALPQRAEGGLRERGRALGTGTARMNAGWSGRGAWLRDCRYRFPSFGSLRRHAARRTATITTSCPVGRRVSVDMVCAVR